MKQSWICIMLLLAIGAVYSVLSTPKPEFPVKQLRADEVTLNGLQLSDSKEILLRAWGDPLAIEEHPTGEEGYLYFKYGDNSSVLLLNERVIRMTSNEGHLVWRNHLLPSPGSNVSDIKDKLGPPHEHDYGTSLGLDYLTDDGTLVQFEFEEEQVTLVSVGKFR